MGLEIKEKDGRFKLKSTVSDESYHPDKKDISLEEAKVLLIHRELFKFIDKVIEIDMDFPNGYNVNGKYNRADTKFAEWYLSTLKSDDCDEITNAKFEEVYKRLGLEFNFNLTEK